MSYCQCQLWFFNQWELSLTTYVMAESMTVVESSDIVASTLDGDSQKDKQRRKSIPEQSTERKFDFRINQNSIEGRMDTSGIAVYGV